MDARVVLSWFFRCFCRKEKFKSPAEWFVVSDQVRLALLRNPLPEDMFWISLEIKPLTSPADPRLKDDNFWLYGTWEIIDVRSNKPIPDVIASSAGINQQSGRVLLRGLHCF